MFPARRADRVRSKEVRRCLLTPKRGDRPAAPVFREYALLCATIDERVRVMWNLKTLVLTAGLAFSLCHAAADDRQGAEPVSWNREEALAYSQAALGRELSDMDFTDIDHRPVRLGSMRGRPLVISMIYTSCYHVCPTLTANLASVVEIAREALGEDSFNVVTIGFDTAFDTPERMRSFAHGRGITDPRWSFLSAEPAVIDALSAELGFIYFASAKGFDHLAQTTVVDAEGRVYRQIYGADIDAPALVEPIKELVFGNRTAQPILSGWIDGIRLFCTIYDPNTGRYRFDYSVFLAAGIGLLSLGAVAYFLISAWRGRKDPV